jgi:hypothetical protein
LKRFAKTLNLEYNKKQKDKALFSELWTRIKESQKKEAKQFVKDFNKTRWSLIQEAMKEPQKLIKWLYEEQGERRFDAANRLFLVLIDKNNLEESWKMKRNIDLLKNTIKNYLDNFSDKDIARLRTEFIWIDGKKYVVLSDAIFVIKE